MKRLFENVEGNQFKLRSEVEEQPAQQSVQQQGNGAQTQQAGSLKGSVTTSFGQTYPLEATFNGACSIKGTWVYIPVKTAQQGDDNIMLNFSKKPYVLRLHAGQYTLQLDRNSSILLAKKITQDVKRKVNPADLPISGGQQQASPQQQTTTQGQAKAPAAAASGMSAGQ